MSDLLLFCNNLQLATPTLLRYAARYPHGTRALVHTADNSEGYRCGHLHAVASSAKAWSAYKHVLFLHPDIYLLPRAFVWLDGALADRPTQRAAFLVTRMYWSGGGPTGWAQAPSTFYGTDLFAFRPPLLHAGQWDTICKVPSTEPPTLGPLPCLLYTSPSPRDS